MTRLRVVGATLVAVAVLMVALPGVWAAPSAMKVLVKNDVYVGGAKYAANKYVRGMKLYAGTCSQIPYRSYLKFDLSGLPENTEVSKAELTVWSRRSYAEGGTSVSVFGTTEDWADQVLSWNTLPPPAPGALDKQTVPGSDGNASNTWDLTAYVAAEAKGDKVVTLVLADSEAPQGTYVWLAGGLDGTVPPPTLDLQLDEAKSADVTPPTISLEMLKDKLWPPNHEMVLCAIVSVTDDTDDAPKVGADGAGPVVTNSEATGAKGSGNTDPDVEVKPLDGLKWEVWLRAERAGTGNGREYTISVVATDAAGNKSEEKVGTVVVPHDQGKGKP